ncbi:MAG TPA: hypothetical protein PLW48_08800 [Alphaproteobacteria bacterium]|nr:hypothetical protein [Alphaproteobacteria bacterium]
MSSADVNNFLTITVTHYPIFPAFANAIILFIFNGLYLLSSGIAPCPAAHGVKSIPKVKGNKITLHATRHKPAAFSDSSLPRAYGLGT